MLGENLKNKRVEKGLSQDEFAKRLSVVRQTVSKWEKGLSVPDSEMLLLIATVLDTSVGELLDEHTVSKSLANKSSRSLKPFEIVLLALGSPIWLSLAVAAFAVILALYVSLWAVIISLWAVFASFIGCAFGGIVAGIVFTCNGNILTGIAIIGAGTLLAGLSVFMVFGGKAATKATLLLTKKIALTVKNRLIKKEEA